MPDIRGSKILVIGEAGFMGSHVVDQLTMEDVKEIIVYDNFVRGTVDNLEEALKDKRVRIFEVGGDILHLDILNKAVWPSPQKLIYYLDELTYKTMGRPSGILRIQIILSNLSQT